MVDGGGYGSHDYADRTAVASGPESVKPLTGARVAAGWR
jgi:hypothetical protein